MREPLSVRLAAALLGRAMHQRVRVSQTLLAIGLSGLIVLAQALSVRLGLMAPDAFQLLALLMGGGSLGFYALIRSGLNLRLPGDPSLTLAQAAYAAGTVCVMYAHAGEARGVVIGLMILIVLFGVFALPAAQSRLLALGAFAGLAAAMAWRSLGPGASYVPAVELVHFAYAAIVMAGTGAVAERLGRLRARLSAQRSELEQALEINRQLATRDMLTGLLNRRAMTELLGQEHERRRRAGGPMAIALLDLDHFKRINDQHGHQAGDIALRRFSELARSDLRGADALSRWGGEEFLLLLPGTSREEAQVVLNRLLNRVRTASFDEVAPGLALTFSAGLALCGADEGIATAIERADRALYAAKGAGRDRMAWA